jgi:hypothetical protein
LKARQVLRQQAHLLQAQLQRQGRLHLQLMPKALPTRVLQKVAIRALLKATRKLKYK